MNKWRCLALVIRLSDEWYASLCYSGWARARYWRVDRWKKKPVELTLGTSTDPKEWRGTESVLNSKRSTLADEVSADASLGILDFFDNTVYTNLQILQDLQVSCRTRASRECLPREDHARRTLMKCSADTVDTQVLLDPLTFCRLDTWLLCMHACNVM